ncbi:MAG TPA: hypothetical protein VNF45_03970 [Candidatus Binataceae bacterium]|nr:hypothetical protein [Candidatus Binataceae bacterium]
MHRRIFNRHFVVTLGVLLGLFASIVARGIAAAAPALSSATIAEDAFVCTGPPAYTTQVSCELTVPPYPGDSYNINATLKLPSPAEWFAGLADGEVSLVLAPGATCAGIASSGLPANAYSVLLPAATVEKNSEGVTALSLGAAPITVQTNSLMPPAPYNLNFELHRDGYKTAMVGLHLSGNASLCGVTSLAIALTDNDNDRDNAVPGSDTVCVDIPRPVISIVNAGNFLFHGCVVSVP